MLIKVYAEDGTEFKGSNYEDLFAECNTYESEVRLKKQIEEEERKAKEEKQKALMQDINNELTKINEMVKNYEDFTSEKLYYVTENDKLRLGKKNIYGEILDLFDRHKFWLW